MKHLLSIFMLVAVLMAMGGNDVVAKESDKLAIAEFSLSPAPVCQNCVNKIRGNLRFVKGVKSIDVKLDTKSVAITYSPKTTDEEKLKVALKKIGYTATNYDPQVCNDGNDNSSKCAPN